MTTFSVAVLVYIVGMFVAISVIESHCEEDTDVSPLFFLLWPGVLCLAVALYVFGLIDKMAYDDHD